MLDLSNQTILYYFTLAVFLFGFLVIYRTINSPFGEILKAIRENEPRAVSLGYRVDQYKLAAFVLSATLSGLGGATKALVAQNASLTDSSFRRPRAEVVLMTLLGGLGTIYGPVVGAFVIVAMQQYLGQYLGEWVTVIQGTAHFRQPSACWCSAARRRPGRRSAPTSAAFALIAAPAFSASTRDPGLTRARQGPSIYRPVPRFRVWAPVAEPGRRARPRNRVPQGECWFDPGQGHQDIVTRLATAKPLLCFFRIFDRDWRLECLMSLL